MGSLTIERVTPKTTKTGKAYASIEASGRVFTSWDLTWKDYIGRSILDSHIVKKGDFLNLPDCKTVFGIPPNPLPQTNGIGVQQTANERWEILDRKVDAVLALLREIRGKFAP